MRDVNADILREVKQMRNQSIRIFVHIFFFFFAKWHTAK